MTFMLVMYIRFSRLSCDLAKPRHRNLKRRKQSACEAIVYVGRVTPVRVCFPTLYVSSMLRAADLRFPCVLSPTVISDQRLSHGSCQTNMRGGLRTRLHSGRPDVGRAQVFYYYWGRATHRETWRQATEV